MCRINVILKIRTLQLRTVTQGLE